jgi:hypothetical protein
VVARQDRAEKQLRRRRGNDRPFADMRDDRGGKVPAEPAIDGRDLSLVLFGMSKQSPHISHYYFSGYNLQAVRQGALETRDRAAN